MSPSRSNKPAGRRGRPRILGPTIPSTPPKIAASLPPPQTGTDTGVSPYDNRTVCPRCGTRNGLEQKHCGICDLSLRTVHPKRPTWWLPPDSKVRRVALQIIAMRIAGMEDDEIAKSLQISPRSIAPYVYRAGKNGWLNLDSPRERLEIELTHKAIDNLSQMLDDNTVLPGGTKIVKHEATHRLLEGTIYKQIGEPAQAPSQSTVVAVKIEMPVGPRQEMREDTIGGTPAYIDAEKVDE